VVTGSVSPAHVSSVPSLQALYDRAGATEFHWPGGAEDASLVFVTDMLARRFCCLPARGGPPGGAAPR